MARLRGAETPQPAGELPPELAVCYVEDWEDGRPPPDYVGDSPEQLTMWRMATAFRRHRLARRQWADAIGIDAATLPSSRPRWRSRESA